VTRSYVLVQLAAEGCRRLSTPANRCYDVWQLCARLAGSYVPVQLAAEGCHRLYSSESSSVSYLTCAVLALAQFVPLSLH
jgi:hypothetical protein